MLQIRNEPKWSRKIKSLCWKIFNDLENNGNCDFVKNGEERFVRDFLSLYKERELTIFDVGANVGLYTEKIVENARQINCFPQIHAFEPTQSCWQQLKQKFANSKNVKLNNFGVSDRSEQSTIYYDRETSGFASLYQRNLKLYNIELSQQEIIELQTLKNYIKENNVCHIDLLKIDIEGHELNALKGLGEFLSPEFVDAIQFEYGGTNLDSHTSLMEITELLTQRGFILHKIMPKYLEKRQYNSRMENFQYANYVALSKTSTDLNFKK
jgi:FkbM family methyltransferase